MQHKAAGRAKHRQHATGSTRSSGEDSEDDEADADARFINDLYSRDEMVYLLDLSDARD